MSFDRIPFSLMGKFIIVTGSSSGIGRECAVACSQMGATVALLGRDLPRLKETQSLMNEPDNHIICPVDLTDYDKIADIVKESVGQRGRLDGLINCAGISTTLPLNAVSPGKMKEFFETNVIGAINLSKQVVKSPHFSERGGSVIFISSVMGSVGEIGKTLYSMTKGAITSAVKSMAVELAPKKIRVNAVSPGVVVTPMSGKAVYSRDEESLNKIKSLHPLGLGEPADVANACVFLLSDAARWITGTNLIVDGGYLAR
jgi:NAD(P)-dependent dehydrogenase (short-subunit alcohol dehydrogenase family)